LSGRSYSKLESRDKKSTAKSMDTAHIAALLEPFIDHPLSKSQLEDISIYIDLLQRWNARINLTAIRDEQEIVTRHFGESLFMASHLFPQNRHPESSPISCHPERSSSFAEREAAAESKDPYTLTSPTPPQGILTAAPRVVDIGSGAGFPGIPLKLWAPQIDLTLVESNHKKAAFLREAARTLRLTNINITTVRAELLAADPSFPRAEVVTLRAVERFQSILPEAIRLMANPAKIALLISTSQLAPPLTTALLWDPPILIPESSARVLEIGVYH
jgi:16S rRNA (guanine527-N7)-methyltransferase